MVKMNDEEALKATAELVAKIMLESDFKSHG